MNSEKNRVIVIEDDSIMGMEMRYALEEWGYEVLDIISTGDKAVQAIQLLRPDVLVMDIKLKGIMTGLDVAREVRSFTEAPIIFLTGYKNSSTQEQVAMIKNSYFLVKPFDLPDLSDLMKQALGLPPYPPAP